MSVSRYFGLPGCGKTTTLTALALKACRSGKYKHIYSNVGIAVHGVTCVPFDVFGVYELRDCLFLVDEAMVVCGDRDHKNFGREKLKEFVMHRHKDCDIVLFSITDRMYYVKKGLILGKWITTIYRIPYDVMFPGDKGGGDNIGAIIMGYKQPSILSRLFAKRMYRPQYYKYFDSWENDELPPLPEEYQPYVDPEHRNARIRPYLHKTTILLRSFRRYKRSLRKSNRRQLLACSLPIV